MSDDPTPETPEDMPRDHADDGHEDDRVRTGDDAVDQNDNDAPQDDEPVRDRPGGPGLTGMRVVGPGEVAPGAPSEDEAPDEDETVADRRDHLRQKEGRGA